MKIGIIVLILALVLIAAASLLVRSYLAPEKMRALVLQIVQKSLEREAAIGEIDVSLFRGIVVRDFEIREKDAAATFIKTKEFILAYKLFPLLTGKLVIDRLSITDAEMYIKANADGAYNFSDLIKKDQPPIPVDDKAKEKAAGLPVALNVHDITIKNAKLGYTDLTGKLQKADVVMNAALKITGKSNNALSSTGEFDITIVQALLQDKEGDKTFKDLRTDLRYKIDLDLATRQLAVHSIDLDVLSIPLNIAGTISYADPAAYVLAIKMPDFNLSRIKPELAAALLPKGMALGGNVALLLNIDKKPDAGAPLHFDGSVRMTKASLAYQGNNIVLDGAVKLTPEMILLDGLQLVAGSNTAGISGSVKNYKEYPDVNISIKSKSIVLDELFASASAQSPQSSPGDKAENKPAAGQGGDVAKEPGPLDLKLKVNVSLDIDKTSYKAMAINNFQSRFELKDNILKIPYLKGNTLRGAFALRGVANLAQKGFRYNMNADLNNLRIEELINAFAPKAKDTLFGSVTGKAAISGVGTLPANVKKNLKGNGQLAIKNGTLKNAELAVGLMTILGLRELKEIPIDQAHSRFTISDGIVHLKTLLGSKDMMIDQTGTISLDEKLDLGIVAKVSAKLAPRLVSQSAIAGFITDDKGWTGVPLRVGGTISKPSYGLDTQAVGRKLGEGLQKKAGEELRRILLPDQDQSSKTQGEKSTDAVDRLRGLFGR
jgi:uncharacterized protein involved in outer membrane biogenesis